MADDSAPEPSKKITDWDLARLLKRGVDELAEDPAAREVHERIRDRQNLEEDRDHRERSDRSSAIGFLVGFTMLAIFVILSILTFEP